MRAAMTALLAVVLVSNVAFAKPAPQFKGELLGGGRASLAKYLKKDRALLLCFWATWCVPCLEELRTVSAKLKADPSLGLDVLAINVDTSETTADVKPFITTNGFTFPVILDPKHEIFAKYHAEKTLPYSVLVDGGGEIRTSFNGYDEHMFAKVREVLAIAKK